MMHLNLFNPFLPRYAIGTRLVRDLVLGIHNSPNNGPIEMIPSGKLIYCVLPIHFACSIIKIGPLVA